MVTIPPCRPILAAARGLSSGLSSCHKVGLPSWSCARIDATRPSCHDVGHESPPRRRHSRDVRRAQRIRASSARLLAGVEIAGDPRNDADDPARARYLADSDTGRGAPRSRNCWRWVRCSSAGTRMPGTRRRWPQTGTCSSLDERLGHPAETQNLLLLLSPEQRADRRHAREQAGAVPASRAAGAGRNVYPRAITREEVDTFLAAHPEDADGDSGARPSCAVQRRRTSPATAQALRTARSAAAPAARARARGAGATPDPKRLYAVPYAVAYAEKLMRAFSHLDAAADASSATTRNSRDTCGTARRDLLTNDYESGDAAWVTGRFKRSTRRSARTRPTTTRCSA